MTENSPDTTNAQAADTPGAQNAEDAKPAADASEQPAAPTPEQRIAALETEKQELRDRMLRIAAEFENWKKRARKEQQEDEAKAKESVLREILEVVDNLERAAAAITDASETKAIQQGVNLVLRLFQSKLERLQVTPFESKGQPFDPRLHDAISQVPTSDAPAGSVLSELQKGYRFGERLLRPASVVVALAPPAPAPPPGDEGGT